MLTMPVLHQRAHADIRKIPVGCILLQAAQATTFGRFVWQFLFLLCTRQGPHTMSLGLGI